MSLFDLLDRFGLIQLSDEEADAIRHLPKRRKLELESRLLTPLAFLLVAFIAPMAIGASAIFGVGVPLKPEPIHPSPVFEPEEKLERDVVLSAQPVATARPALSERGPSEPSRAPIIYVVQKGDCLWSIIEGTYGGSDKAIHARVSEVLVLNAGLDPDALRVGQEVRLPPKGEAESADRRRTTGSQGDWRFE